MCILLVLDEDVFNPHSEKKLPQSEDTSIPGILRDMFYTHHSKEKRPERISGFQTILLNVVKGCKGL